MKRFFKPSQSKRERILSEYNYLCVYCGDAASEVDHILPYSYKINNSDSNLVASCKICNLIAGSKIFDNFSLKKSYILGERKSIKWRRKIGANKSLCSDCGNDFVPRQNGATRFQCLYCTTGESRPDKTPNIIQAVLIKIKKAVFPSKGVYEYKPKATRKDNPRPIPKQPPVRKEITTPLGASIDRVVSEPYNPKRQTPRLTFLQVNPKRIQKRSIEYTALQSYIYALKGLGFGCHQISSQFMIGVSTSRINEILKGSSLDDQSIKILYSRLPEFRATRRAILGR